MLLFSLADRKFLSPSRIQRWGGLKKGSRKILILNGGGTGGRDGGFFILEEERSWFLPPYLRSSLAWACGERGREDEEPLREKRKWQKRRVYFGSGKRASGIGGGVDEKEGEGAFSVSPGQIF